MNTKFPESENEKRFFPMSPQCRKDCVTWRLLPSTSETTLSFLVCFQYAIHLRKPYCTTSGHTTHTMFHVKSVPGIVQLGSLESMVIQRWAKPDKGPPLIKLILSWRKYQYIWHCYHDKPVIELTKEVKEGFPERNRLRLRSEGWAEVVNSRRGKGTVYQTQGSAFAKTL